MKKLSLLALFTVFTVLLFAQQIPDQNPDFNTSRSKYMAVKDSLLRSQSTTVQNTYKAYDWMQLKQERKDTRFQNRQQRRLNRSLNDGSYYGFGSLYPYGSYNLNYYSNSYHSNRFYRNNYYSGRSYYNNYSPRFSDVWWWLLF